MKMFICCVFVVLASFIFSCNGKNKKMEVLPLDTIKVVMWDLLNAEELNNLLILKDSALLKTKNNLLLYQQVFYLHHISKEQFYYSYQFYEKHPDRFKILMDSVSSYGPRQRFKMSGKAE